MMQRKHIQVFGTVQGVGFRHHTELIAKKLGIFGTVQNVEDYVDIYAQGDEEQIKSFIDKVIAGAAPASSVSDYSIEDLDVTNRYSEFKTIY